jgi:hypothetical protein
MFNAVAANKRELERLLVSLSGDSAVSSMGVVALLNGYITRLETRCSDLRAQIEPQPGPQTENLKWN